MTRLRNERGWSAQTLADRTVELGHPVSLTIVANLANRKRRTRLTVPDWLVLAAALDVPPALLLTPSMPATEVEAMPGWTVPAVRAYYWISGQGYGGGYGDMASAVDYVAAVDSWTKDAVWLGIVRAERGKAERDGASDDELRAHDRRVSRAMDAFRDADRAGRVAAIAAGMTWDPPADVAGFLASFTEDGPADG